MIAEEDVAGIDTGNVTAWLVEHVDGAVAPFRFDIIAGGHSNLTYLVQAADGRRLVLRRPPLGHVLASAHDMGREHRIIAGLQGSGVPVPPALGFCDDAAVNGAPFYVMGYVDGIVVRDRTIAEHALDAGGARTRQPLARRHDGRDPRRRPRCVRAQPTSPSTRATSPASCKRWYGQWNLQKTRELPLVDEVHDALAGMIPPQGPATIVHGDYRLDNTIVSADGDVQAVLDWEICTLGDPLADVGLLEVYWTGPDDEQSAWAGRSTTAPGFWNRDRIAARYAEVVRPRPRRRSTSTSRSGSGSWRACWRACTPATSAARSAIATLPSCSCSRPRSTPRRRRWRRGSGGCEAHRPT